MLFYLIDLAVDMLRLFEEVYRLFLNWTRYYKTLP